MKIKGIDISFYQKNIDFTKVKNDGIIFAILREGYRKTIDSKFLQYVKGCQLNNIYIMVYHFIYTDGATPKQNAQSTYNNIKKAGLNPAETWIAADLEYDTWKKNGEKCTKAKCTQYTKQYLQALKALGCNKLLIYTNNDYYKNYYDWSQLSQYPIWLADYVGEPDQKCMIQQYSSKGKVNGINGAVDMNWLYDESILSNFAQEKVKESFAATASKVLQVAMKEEGYLEKKSNSSLDNKTANAGSNNYTKYARDFDQKYPRWYNGKKNGYAWCDMFVDWCFLTAFGYDKALELLCQPEKSLGAGCKYSYRYFKNKGQAGRVPSVGAQIFFGNSEDTINHTGLVYKIDGAFVYTIEGNSENKVAYRKYHRGAPGLWYGYPKYDSEPIEQIPEQKTTSDLSIGSTGNEVKELQKNLTSLGYYCAADGIFGNKTQAAFKEFQSKNGLAVDGVYGPKSKAKLKELLSQQETQTATTENNYNSSKIAAAKSFNSSIAKTYTTTAKLNLRTGPSMSYDIIVMMPKGAKVTCYGYYTNDWYYVVYDKYKGFCAKQWLK